MIQKFLDFLRKRLYYFWILWYPLFEFRILGGKVNDSFKSCYSKQSSSYA